MRNVVTNKVTFRFKDLNEVREVNGSKVDKIILGSGKSNG